MDGSVRTLHLLRDTWPVLDSDSLKDQGSPKAQEHHVNKLRNLVAELGTIEIDVVQMHWHMVALDGTEALVDASLVL